MAQKFIQHTGVVAPIDAANVNTDIIIPKQFLQKVTRTAFAIHAFHEWRFLDDAGKQPNPEFILNQARYRDASILLTRENFGCGSSREHAPWALQDYGFKVIIGSSFADIFYNNSFNNHLLLVTLSEEVVDELFKLVEVEAGMEMTVDLEKEEVIAAGKSYPFKIDAFKRYCLLNGLDNIGLTLQHEDAISAYEKRIPAFLN